MNGLITNTLLDKEDLQVKIGQNTDSFYLGSCIDSVSSFAPELENDKYREDLNNELELEHLGGIFIPKSIDKKFNKAFTKYLVIYNNDDSTIFDTEIVTAEEKKTLFSELSDDRSFFFIGNTETYKNKKINTAFYRLNSRFVNYGFRLSRKTKELIEVNYGTIVINTKEGNNKRLILVEKQEIESKVGDDIFIKLNISLNGRSDNGLVGTSNEYPMIPEVLDQTNDPNNSGPLGDFIYSDQNGHPLNDGGKSYGIGVDFVVNSVEYISSDKDKTSEELKIDPNGGGQKGDLYIKIGSLDEKKITQERYGNITLEHVFFIKTADPIPLDGFFTQGNAPSEDAILTAFLQALRAIEAVDGYSHHFSLMIPDQIEWDHLKLY